MKIQNSPIVLSLLVGAALTACAVPVAQKKKDAKGAKTEKATLEKSASAAATAAGAPVAVDDTVKALQGTYESPCNSPKSDGKDAKTGEVIPAVSNRTTILIFQNTMIMNERTFQGVGCVRDPARGETQEDKIVYSISTSQVEDATKGQFVLAAEAENGMKLELHVVIQDQGKKVSFEGDEYVRVEESTAPDAAPQPAEASKPAIVTPESLIPQVRTPESRSAGKLKIVLPPPSPATDPKAKG